MTGNITILYPTDYFDHSIADEMFETERQIAIELGFDTALFDYVTGKLLSENSVDATHLPSRKSNGMAIYRGWQSPYSEYYENTLYPLLSSFGTPLVSYEQYDFMRSSDKYEALVGYLMPKSVNVPTSWMTDDRLREILQDLGGKAFAKDYVKSVLGVSCLEFDEDGIGISKARSVLNAIERTRGGAFAGGFCIKQWCDFEEQVRVFVLQGEPVLLVAHDGKWSGTTPPNIPCDLPSPFYTVDMGFDAITNKWLVVECGDGQESDCGSEDAMHVLYEAFATRLK